MEFNNWYDSNKCNPPKDCVVDIKHGESILHGCEYYHTNDAYSLDGYEYQGSGFLWRYSKCEAV